MFKSSFDLLLAGEFICSVVYPEEHAYLSQERNFLEVSNFFDKLSIQIKKTPSGDAFYIVSVTNNANGKTFSEMYEINLVIYPMISFLDLVVRKIKNQTLVNCGDEIRQSILLSKIEEDAVASNELQTLSVHCGPSGVNVKTDRDRLDRVFKFLCNNGYLHLKDKEKGLYVITGKIEYAYSVLEIIDNNVKFSTDVIIPIQGELL